jgi:hypothetical protein
MGGVVKAVGSLLGGGGSAPAAPDYTGAANQTAANNLKAAQAATAANRVNQFTPYGDLNYAQTGTDAQGNPIWSATQSVAPGLQPAVTASQQAVSGYNYSPFAADVNPLQTGVDPSVTGQQGWDKATNAILQRLNPTIQRQNEMSDQQLANQGIMPGSQAYNVAKQQIAEQQNDLLTQASLGGAQVQNQMYNQALANAQLGNQANQIGFGQQLSAYGTNLQSPLTYAQGVKSLATPNLINPAQQQTTGGADTLSAANMQYQNQLANYNAEQARNSQMLGGLIGLGSTAMLAPTGTFSGLTKAFGGGAPASGGFGMSPVGGGGFGSLKF